MKNHIRFGHHPKIQTLKLLGGHTVLLPWLWRGFSRTGHGLSALLCANPDLADCGLPTAPKLSRYGSREPFLPSLAVDDPVDAAAVETFAADNGFPLVLKPLFGSRSRSIRKIESIEDLTARPLEEPMMLQPYVDLPYEYGVNISRIDGQTRVYALTEVRLRSDVAPETTEHGAEILGVTNGFRDLTEYISPQLVDACEDAARQIGLSFGRFDVKAASLEALLDGRFCILEANGPLSVNLAFYDESASLRERLDKLRLHWTELFRHARGRVTPDIDARQAFRDFVRYFRKPRQYAVSFGSSSGFDGQQVDPVVHA